MTLTSSQNSKIGQMEREETYLNVAEVKAVGADVERLVEARRPAAQRVRQVAAHHVCPRVLGQRSEPGLVVGIAAARVLQPLVVLERLPCIDPRLVSTSSPGTNGIWSRKQ